jgi:hypothetical protein
MLGKSLSSGSGPIAKYVLILRLSAVGIAERTKRATLHCEVSSIRDFMAKATEIVSSTCEAADDVFIFHPQNFWPRSLDSCG